MSDFEESVQDDESAIAIVGLACHLPGALNLQQYWNNLRDGVESIRFYTDEELLAAGESAAVLADPNYVRAQPFLENFDRFDAKFWGFSPQDAAVTDPAHRLFLEVAYQSLEHAGHTGYDAEGTVGVFATSGASLYWMENLNTNPQLIDEMGEFLVRHTGNDTSFLATRLSYELDLRGPSLNVQTACSSSLVAVHMAVQSLLGAECDMAIAGASTVLLPQKRGYLYKEGEIMSPDGHCRPFDAKSAGTVFGSGAGAVVLRRLDDALADGDTIYAVIHGSAINNDGAQKVGYLAPGVEGQAHVVAEALDISGIKADEVSYIEAHGTGTLVGDPIEFEALNQIYSEAASQRSYCRVGSVKSNIGHLGEAAGAAAIIKVILALQHKQLPPTINYDAPNPDIELNHSPFLINDKLVEWDTPSERIAGITALGAGGTNAHVIIGEAPEPSQLQPSQLNNQLLVVSAKTETALSTSCRNLAQAMREQDDLDLADIAYTLQVGRRAYSYRRVLAVSDKEEAIFLLESSDAKRVAQFRSEDRAPSLVFMFPGGGAQYAGMGAELYEAEVVYRQAFDACLGCLESSLAEEIKSLVFAKEQREQASKKLEQPSRTLPSLFATEYALAKQLMAWGAVPIAFMGHSMGEYTAACLSGVISLNDAMRLVLLRGQLFEKVALGAMLSISLPETEARRHMAGSLDIAAVNADDLCVASGPVEDIERLQRDLEEKDIDCMRIRIDVAAHSSMLDSILDEFRQFCHSIHFSNPEIPFTSNLKGGWITEEQATDPDYWVQHLRNTVRFADNVATVLADDSRVLVEVGPGRTLTNLAQAGEVQAQATFNAMRHASELDVGADSDVKCALRTHGKIWAAGATVDWRLLWGEERRRRIALPGYPFERKIYWIDPGAASAVLPPIAESLDKRSDITQWFGQYNWAQTSVPNVAENIAEESIDQSWLIFEDEVGLAELIVAELADAARIVRVKRADVFERVDDGHYRLAANNIEHFSSLMQSLEKTGHSPQRIVYLWPMTLPVDYPDSSLARLNTYDRQSELCFWGLFNLSKILSEMEDAIRLTVVSSDMHAIGNISCPEKSTLLGPVSVLPHELAHVKTQSIDVSPSLFRRDSLSRIARQLTREMNSKGDDRIVAYRGTDRLIRHIEQEPLEANTAKKTWLRNEGSYLISGGLGGIGLAIARYLASQGAATIALLSRRSLPDRSQWQDWVEQHAAGDTIAHQIKAVQEIEQLGATVITLSADITDYDSTRCAVEAVNKECGLVHGIIHAAGSIDDQLILLKSQESARKVIDAKIKGALILDSLFSEHFTDNGLDFFIVFSSVASYLGLPGQIDYAAANAFLDAFAKDRAQRESGESLAINWNAWRDVGMTALQHRTLNEGEDASAERHLVNHPALDHYIELGNDKWLFSTRFRIDDYWLLSEHRVKAGAALMPGTGFIELFRAAFAQYCCNDAAGGVTAGTYIELSDVQFFTAFQVPDHEDKSLHLEIDGQKQRAGLSIYSESEHLPHAVANAQLLTGYSADAIDIAQIRARCDTAAVTRDKFLDQDFMNFGPRWGCINSICWAGKEALLDIELAETYTADLETYRLHPGLLDMATGGVQFLIDGFSKETDFYVPVGYERVAVYGAMPCAFVSHVRTSDTAMPGFAEFDVTLMDNAGVPFVEITGYTMKKVAVDFGLDVGQSDIGARAAPGNQSDVLDDILSKAILPAEGVEAFERIMSQTERAQWIVSSVDSALWMKQLDTSDQLKTSKISYIKEDTHDPDADSDIAEIEQCLLEHQSVSQAFVRSFLDESGQRRLIAYFYPDDFEEAVTVSDLRKYVRSAVSEGKVPQQFIEIDEVPIDSQDEPDRSQLKDPFAPEDNYVAPHTPTEKELARIWQDALGIEQVSLNENFFDIGGHSLLSIRVIIRVDKHFGVRLDQPMMAMQTLEQIASEIDGRYNISGLDKESKEHTPPEQALPAEKSCEKKAKSGIRKLFGRK